MATDRTAWGAGQEDAVCIDHEIGGKREPRQEGVDRLLAELARCQHGVVSRRQLLARGVGRRALDTRLKRGSLHAVHRGVYSVGHSSLTLQGRRRAAVFAGGSKALLSHRSAARLWRLMRPCAAPIEVARPRNGRPREGIVFHRAQIPDDEQTVVDGTPVTTVPRTILDLAALLPRRQVELAVNEAEVRRLWDELSIVDLLDRYPGRRGSAVLREILADEARCVGVPRNDFEELFMGLVHRYRLPQPRFNADVAVADRFFEVDCVWDEPRVIVELDGRGSHGTRRAFEDDRERDRLLVTDGWRIVRVTWRQLRDEEATIATDLRKVLASLPFAG